MQHIINIAQQWLNQDPDAETREELQALIDNKNIAELKKRFADRLQFGTAGLRGPLQAGSMGMNRVLVAQAAAGLAKFLLENRTNHTIVIGYDARKNSRRFAEDTAEIMQAAGIKAQLMPDLRPTPVLAYALRKLNAGAGVMVTASHNPPQDNGYKVYLGDEDEGAQIVSPIDQKIADCIAWIADNMTINDIPRDHHYQQIDKAIIDEYIQTTAAIHHSQPKDSKFVYTAMHGIGTETLLATLKAADLPTPILVNEQCEPDGTFPTVSFPNPEEAGAMDLALATAKTNHAEFILANDPDADRLAVAVPDEQGNWAMLQGNELGLYLAWHIAQRAQKSGQQGSLACSLVSSPLLADVAEKYGLQHAETLTGFKWISRVPNLLFGYEEALGYLVDPAKVRDKDGISAAICFLDLINHLKNQGKTFNQYRQEFVATFGAFASGQLSIRVEDLERIQRMLSAVRTTPFSEIANMPVEEYVDHLKTELNENILVFRLSGGQRIIFRPSGTEPKLKMYLDTKAVSVSEAKTKLEQIKTALADYLDAIK